MPLSVLIWLPAASALLAGFAPRRSTSRIALLGALATLGLAIGTLAAFDRDQAGLQFVTDRMWISALGIHYKLGLDGLNVFLVVLGTLLFAAAVLAATLREWERPRLFYFHLGLAESAVLGALTAQDL